MYSNTHTAAIYSKHLSLIPHQRWLGQLDNYHHLDVCQKQMVGTKPKEPLLSPRTYQISFSLFWQWRKFNAEPTLKEIGSIIAQARTDLKNYFLKLPVGLRKIK